MKKHFKMKINRTSKRNPRNTFLQEKKQICFDKLISEENLSILLRVINTEYKPKKVTLYSIEYYLYHILLVLNKLQTWESLTYVRTLQSNSPYHFKTICDIHKLWSDLGIYKKAFYEISKQQFSDKLEDEFIILFIDTSNVYNINGMENVGFGGANRKKKHSDLSVISNQNGIPCSLMLIPAKSKTLEKKLSNGDTKTSVIKTFPHDSQTTIMAIEEAIKHNEIKSNIILVGDSGFQSEDVKMFLEFDRIELVTSKKKNAKIKNNETQKTYLKGRYKVENCIARVKRFKRICFRQDKLDNTYMGFVFLGAITTYNNLKIKNNL